MKTNRFRLVSRFRFLVLCLWESLVYEENMKENLLNYTNTTLQFAECAVNPQLISCNRVVLLHGPPGTGKTSLCKAIAQKISIRFAERFPNTYLLEINAHSLFSKWFSESGKLVLKLFQHIEELVQDPDSLICVLIDEIESLTSARENGNNGSDPSDAIRVVNAVLTQLDQLRTYTNVLILTTSNITKAIDVAFVDRTDIKQYIGYPSEKARFEILKSCVDELIRVGIVLSDYSIPSYDRLKFKLNHDTDAPLPKKTKIFAHLDAQNNTKNCSDIDELILEAASLTQDFSGRALRKLPFQAHAFFIQAGKCELQVFMNALVATIQAEKVNTKHLV